MQLRDEQAGAATLPESVLHYVLGAGETVILDDASAQSAFGDDPYIRERQTRSILCLPVINQGKLNGVVYLENNPRRLCAGPDSGPEVPCLSGRDRLGERNPLSGGPGERTAVSRLRRNGFRLVLGNRSLTTNSRA